MKSKSVKKHVGTENEETYVLKLKDRPKERSGIVIQDPTGEVMKIKTIKVLKIPGKNNEFMVVLDREPEVVILKK